MPQEILLPRSAWPSPQAYDTAAARLSAQFRGNFSGYAGHASTAVHAAGPA